MEQTPSTTASRDVNPVKRPGVMRRWSYQAVAHGADAVLFFQMRRSRRRLITDAVRAVDAVRGLPGVDGHQVAVVGNSQGGGLAIAVAGLVPDLTTVQASVPFLCHVERALGDHRTARGENSSTTCPSTVTRSTPPCTRSPMWTG